MPPRAFGPLSTTSYTASGVSFDMVRVPPGRFVDGERAEKRTLLVSRPFEIGLTLVTQALWQAVMSRRPSSFRGDDRPVEWVSWDDVQTFLRQLDSLGLRGFRLSTEAEWAWAARWAGADRAKPVAVVNQDGTRPVGGLLPSAAGALDLSGNVLEWQQDWLSDSPAAGVDTEGPALESFRVSRGGNWSNAPQDARVALGDSDPPGFRGIILGVRLFRSVP